MKKIIIFLLLISFLITGMIYTNTGEKVVLDNAYIKGDILSISAVNDGVITEIFAHEGTYIKRGEKLFAMDNFDSEATIELLKEELRFALLEEIEACMEVSMLQTKMKKVLTELDYSKEQKQVFSELQQSNAISLAELKLKELQENLDQTSLDLVEKEIEFKSLTNRNPIMERPKTKRIVEKLRNAFRINVANTVLAPYDGYVYGVFTYPGNYIKRGEKVLTFISSMNVKVEANVLETDLEKVKLGMPVLITTDISHGQKTFAGRVQSIVPSIAAEFSLFPRNNTDSNWIKVSQRVPVLFQFDEPDEIKFSDIPIGTSVTVSINEPSVELSLIQYSVFNDSEAYSAIPNDWEDGFQQTLNSLVAKEIDYKTQALIKSCANN